MSNRFADRSLDTGGGSSEGGNVDWDALNAYVCKTVQDTIECSQGNAVPVIGYISGIVEYGQREYEPVEEMLVDPNSGSDKANAFRAKMVENKKGKVFIAEDGKTEMIRYTPTTAKEVGYFIDFPSILLDKGQFFGDTSGKLAPYRILIGGQFKGVPARPVKVSGYSKNQDWYCGDGSYHVKLAKAVGINTKEGFKQKDLLSLIGGVLSFNLEVYLNKSGDNTYLQEKINTPNKLMAGLPKPEINEDLLFYVGMNDPKNTEADIKLVSGKKFITEYWKGASNWEGSKLQAQLAKISGGSDTENAGSGDTAKTAPSEVVTNKVAPQQAVTKPTPQPEPDIEFDDDIPF